MIVIKFMGGVCSQKRIGFFDTVVRPKGATFLQKFWNFTSYQRKYYEKDENYSSARIKFFYFHFLGGH